jgi:glycosyltransferase involved in cell wall biosynthesis
MPIPFYPQVRVGIAGPMRVGTMIRLFAPDLVHIATEGPLGLSALLASRWLRIPVASSFHTNFDHYASHYGFFGADWIGFRYLRWFHNRTRVTLVPSRATQARLTLGGFHHVKIWSRGVDATQFNPTHRDHLFRQSLGVGEDDTLLLYVGRLAAEKNLPVLLEAFRRLHTAQQGKVRLALVGHGPLSESLARNTPPGVILAGVQHGASLSRWYASADLFAFPSLSETFGNVVQEAQASGLAVVGFDCQGVNEQVSHEINGLLVPMGGDMVPALQQLCENSALRRTFRDKAREYAQTRDWQPIFDALESCYRGILTGQVNAERQDR